jgi:[acyl-carrier-protein] S-malonyltransferase
VKDLGFKAIKLNVSAPFHCDLMKLAESRMDEALREAVINKPLIPVVQNITARPTTDVSTIKQNLVSQVCGRVRWRETLIELEKLGVQEIVEIGAGKVLTSMIKKTTHKFKLVNISNLAELEEYKF